MDSTHLTIRSFSVREVCFGSENRITQDGRVTLKADTAAFCRDEPLLRGVSLRILPPGERRVQTNTVMDVIPLSAKALGRIGEGVTHTVTGLYVLLTGADENGRQITNGGGNEGLMEEHIAWGRPGTPCHDDWLIAFDVVTAADAWASREGVNAVYRACDAFCAQFRDQLRKFSGAAATEVHHFQDEYHPGRPDVVIVKEVSGQGAVYDTVLFPDEPCGFAGGRSIIDMGCMPVFLTANQVRDGAIRALD